MKTQGPFTKLYPSPAHPRWKIACKRWLVRLAMVILLSQRTPLHAALQDASVLLLEVQLNGYPLGKIGEFSMHKGELLSRPDELRDLGLRVPATAGRDDLIPLSALPGLIWRIEETTQKVYLTAPAGSLNTTVLKVDPRSGSDLKVETGTGVTLNYDLVNTLTGMQDEASGSFDFRAFSPLGVLTSGTLAYVGRGAQVESTNHVVRLDTAYTFAHAASLDRYTLGDFINGGLSWTRPVHLEGFQVRSDFGMRPDLVTFPLPSVAGSTAIPSTVDVLANGITVLSQAVNPGPFEIPQLPVVSGAGNISVTVTDALGHPTTVNQPFYASTSLLKPGLQAFSAQGGLVRLNWGAISNDYGELAGSGTYRRGLTSKITVEGSVEATPKVAMEGSGLAWNVHDLGVINFALATSTSAAKQGGQYTAGLQRIGRMFSISGTFTAASVNFRDIAALSGQPVPRQQISGNAGFTLRRAGSLGLAFAALDQLTSTPIAQGLTGSDAISEGTALVAHPRVLSASYTLQMRHVSLQSSLFRDFGSTAGTRATIGLTIPFGRTGSLTANVGSDSSLAQVQVRKSAVSVGDWGYDAFVSGGDSFHEFLEVEHKSRTALSSLGMDHTGTNTTLVAETQGAVSYADHGVFPSNTIYDSFAIVDTGGLQNVHVLEENRPIGITDRKGRLLVPDLRSFDQNHIEINPTDVPMDTSVASIVHDVRPQDHSGVVVKFKIHISQSVLLQMVDEEGVWIPVGSTATLRSTGVTVPVGFDGEAFLEDLSASNDVDVVVAGGRKCNLQLDYKPAPGLIPTVGPKLCRAVQ